MGPGADMLQMEQDLIAFLNPTTQEWEDTWDRPPIPRKVQIPPWGTSFLPSDS